jgi:ribulose-phosphate 3-epimerase
MIPLYQETAGRLMICPSILSADFAALGAAVRMVAADADLIHVDIMDGHYVPNLTIGPPVVKDLRRVCSLPMDVHLMIENPLQWIDAFTAAGADSLVVHAEACPHLMRAVQLIAAAGVSPGVAVNPGTPLSAVEEVLPHVDLVLLMAVNPGFGGQQFIPGMLGKIRRMRDLISQLEKPIHLQVDGGVHAGNIREIYQAGADLVAVGSSVFGKPDPAAAIRELKRCAS